MDVGSTPNACDKLLASEAARYEHFRAGAGSAFGAQPEARRHPGGGRVDRLPVADHPHRGADAPGLHANHATHAGSSAIPSASTGGPGGSAARSATAKANASAHASTASRVIGPSGRRKIASQFMRRSRARVRERDSVADAACRSNAASQEYTRRPYSVASSAATVLFPAHGEPPRKYAPACSAIGVAV